MDFTRISNKFAKISQKILTSKHLQKYNIPNLRETSPIWQH